MKARDPYSTQSIHNIVVNLLVRLLDINLFAEENIQKLEASIPRLLLQLLEQSFRRLQQKQISTSYNYDIPGSSFKTKIRLVSKVTNIKSSIL